MDAARPVPRLLRGGRASVVVPRARLADASGFSVAILRLNASVLMENSPPDFARAAAPRVFREP